MLAALFIALAAAQDILVPAEAPLLSKAIQGAIQATTRNPQHSNRRNAAGRDMVSELPKTVVQSLQGAQPLFLISFSSAFTVKRVTEQKKGLRGEVQDPPSTGQGLDAHVRRAERIEQTAVSVKHTLERES